MNEHAAGPGSSPFDGFDPRLRWAILISIVGPVVWLTLTLLYVGFWASGFTVFQSVVIVLVSLLVLAGVMGTTWFLWSSGHPELRRAPAAERCPSPKVRTDGR